MSNLAERNAAIVAVRAIATGTAEDDRDEEEMMVTEDTREAPLTARASRINSKRKERDSGQDEPLPPAKH